MREKSSHQKKLILYVDGAARGNPGPAGIGAVICSSRGKELKRISEYLGEATNNVAEYSALIFALQEAKKYRAEWIKIYADSQLLVQQLKGEYKIKNRTLKLFFERAKHLMSPYQKVELFYISRAKNKGADKIANEAIEKYLAGEKVPKRLKGIPTQEELF